MSARLLTAALLALSLVGCGTQKRVIMLGFDGCDPKLLRTFMEAGKLPNFQRLEQMGGCYELGTTTPPQSPVAWATVVTGLDPGGTGIFDFLERDPRKMLPVPSMTVVENGRSKLLRDGATFWSRLQKVGIPCLLLKAPADFPPPNDGSHLLTGMGTPDLLGTYGTFTFYSETPREISGGGTLVPVKATADKVRASLIGPDGAALDFTAFLDRKHQTALLDLSGRELLLKKGEWGDWVPVRFAEKKVGGIVRFHLKSVQPFGLYASPINLDPADPAQPISSPASFSAHLADCCGPFYTQGMAEDTKALSSGVLNDEEYLQQSHIVLEESWKLLRQGLKEFQTGFFFCYLSSTDLQSHLYYRTLDPDHPGYNAEEARLYGHVIEDTYREADKMVGEVLAKMDAQTTLLVLSDHGFAPFRRSFDTNAWLTEQGYFKQADWGHTRAYAMGFNGVYVNLAGREASGIVPEGEREKLLDELIGRLRDVTDPKTGQKVFVNLYKGREIYSGPHLDKAPDLVLGYQRGYRSSWETALGHTGPAVLRDNLEHWSGDHLMDPSVVPGVLLCSRKLKSTGAHLRDLAPTVLGLFGQPATGLPGKNLLEE